MNIDFSEQLLGWDDKPVKADDTGQFVTLKTLCMLALNQKMPNKSLEENMKAYQLGKKIFMAEDVVDITAEEIVELKERLSLISTPLFLGRAIDCLEGRSKVKQDA